MLDVHKNLKERVMKRVFGFWFLKSVIPLLVIEFGGIALALYLFARLVFIRQVVHNALGAALGNPYRFMGYLWGAFLHASFAVEGLMVILVVGLVLVLKNINRIIISYALMRRSEFLNSRKY